MLLAHHCRSAPCEHTTNRCVSACRAGLLSRDLRAQALPLPVATRHPDRVNAGLRACAMPPAGPGCVRARRPWLYIGCTDDGQAVLFSCWRPPARQRHGLVV